MKCIGFEIECVTGPGISIHDLTETLRDRLTACGVMDGTLTISSLHTTAAVTVNEHEQRLLDDLQRFLARLAPAGDGYRHDDIEMRDCPPDEPRNAHSHLLAMMLGNSESIGLANGELRLGRWQSVMLVELDGPRERRVAVQVVGNPV